MPDMKPITIRLLNKEISDIYCYVGLVIFTTHIGEVYSIPMSQIYSDLSVKYDEFKGFLKIALVNNEWISNEQFEALIQKNTRKAFEKDWDRASRNIFEYQVLIDNCQKLGKTSGFPIYDIKAYAHHIFIAHGKGLDDFRISGDTSKGLKVIDSQKKFDHRVLNVSAKIGQVLVSTGKDGLFGGSIWDEYFKISEDIIEKESYKTLWTSWNFNNYISGTEFNHFVNLTIDEPERKFYYSRQDEERSKKRLTEIGVEVLNSNDLIREKDNRYIVNSNEVFFLFKNSGAIVTQRLKRDDQTSWFSSHAKTIYPSFKEKIIEVKAAKNSLAIETFDSLFLLTDSKLVELSKSAPLNFRTYLSSIRLRNLVSAIFPDYSEIYFHA
jgi:hypothetical protein